MHFWDALTTRLLRALGQCRGASGIEYGLLLGLLAVTVMAAVGSTGYSVSSVLCVAASRLGNVTGLSSSSNCTMMSASVPSAPALSWNMVTSPNMTVTAPSTTGTPLNFILSNTGTAATGTLTFANTNTTNLPITANTCGTGPLAARNGQCQVTVTPTATTNLASYVGALQVTDSNPSDPATPAVVSMSGSAGGFPVASVCNLAVEPNHGYGYIYATIPIKSVMACATGTNLTLSFPSYSGAVQADSVNILYPDNGYGGTLLSIPMTGTSLGYTSGFAYEVTDSNGNSSQSSVYLTLGACQGGEAVGTICTEPDLNQTVVSGGTSYNATIYLWPKDDATSIEWDSDSAFHPSVQVFSPESSYPDYNGQAETAALVALDNAPLPAPYPPADLCVAHNGGASGPWYLPTGAELSDANNQGYALSALNAAFNAIQTNGGATLSTGGYWTASEVNAYYAEAFHFGSMGGYGEIAKSKLFAVRCVRR